MNRSIKSVKHTATIMVCVVILSTFTNGQGFLQNAGFDAEIFTGTVHVLGAEGSQYGLRLGYWPRSWISIGFETAIASNLNKIADMDFIRYHLFTALHLRLFKHIHPYVIGTLGRNSEPDTHYFAIVRGDEFSYLEKESATIKFGLALEVKSVRIALETGGGTMGSGHTENNFALSYALKPLPKPRTVANYTITSGFHNFIGFSGPYEGQENYPGFDFALEIEENGRIREYNVGIFFTDYVFSTGVFNAGTGWRIKGDHKVLEYLDVTPGVQLLIWAEPFPDFILPAASLGLSTKYQLWKFVLFAKTRMLATINSEYTFLSGATYTFGVGLAF